jgi:uncharacterized protein (DUF934 family)
MMAMRVQREMDGHHSGVVKKTSAEQMDQWIMMAINATTIHNACRHQHWLQHNNNMTQLAAHLPFVQILAVHFPISPH